MRLTTLLYPLLNWLEKHTLLFIACILLLRSLFLFTNNIVLIGDESYYWEWSRQPDWCYYSKPPMVAWLIAASTWFFGDSVSAIRFPTLLLGTLFLGYFHAIAKAIYGERTAAFALLLILATPNNVIANLLMTIDPPLYCFWIMTLYYLQRGLFDNRLSAWFWAGVCNALALLSKQLAIMMPFMLLVFMLSNKNYRQLLTRQFVCYCLPIVLASLPIIVWNQQHDWIMFVHSQSHFNSQTPLTWAKRLSNAKNIVFYQALLISPLIFLAILSLTIKQLIGFRNLTSQQQFLLFMGPLPLLGFLILTLLQKTQGIWPMPFYFSAILLLAGNWQLGYWRRWLHVGLITGLLLVLITYFLPVLLHTFNLQDTKLNPLRRYQYWPSLANAIDSERLKVPSLKQGFVVALGHRYLASEMAFYLPDHPKVYRYQVDGNIVSQYELWSGPEAFIGDNALIISDASNPVPEAIKNSFLHFSYISQVANPKQADSPYQLYLGEQLQHWPINNNQHPVIFED